MFSPPTKNTATHYQDHSFNDVYGSSKYTYILKTKQTPQINFTNDTSYNVKWRDDQNYQTIWIAIHNLHKIRTRNLKTQIWNIGPLQGLLKTLKWWWWWWWGGDQNHQHFSCHSQLYFQYILSACMVAKLSNDMCTQAEWTKQALFKIFQPISKLLHCS